MEILILLLRRFLDFIKRVVHDFNAVIRNFIGCVYFIRIVF